MKPVCLSKLHLLIILDKIDCFLFQSNGEQSKEDCYKQCAKFCNQEKDRVKAAFDEFTRTLRGTDIFQYVLDNTLPTTWEPVGKDDCYDYCKTNDYC